jgi:glycosyltransferase involved in cell wall biosynthesis
MISIIIPVRNGARTVGEQLEALASQDYAGEKEIIVADNGSTDTTVAVVEAYRSHMPYLRLVAASERPGASHARNTGVSHARGDLYLFTDADDIVAPGWVTALAAALEEHDLVVGVMQTSRLNEQLAWQRPSPPNGAQPVLGFLPYAPGGNFGVTRRAFEAAGGFSDRFYRGQDIDFSWRVQLAGYPLQVIPEAMVYYRYRDTVSQTWQQLVAFSQVHVLLYRHYAAHGMPRSSRREVTRRYRRLLRRSPALLRQSQEDKMDWLYQAALSWGRLVGSLRYQTLYL